MSSCFSIYIGIYDVDVDVDDCNYTDADNAGVIMLNVYILELRAICKKLF